MVVEIWAAVAGASIGVAASGIKGANRENQHGRDSLVRLTSAVDNLASRMDVLHADLRVRDQELIRSYINAGTRCCTTGRTRQQELDFLHTQ
jgi:hypothetical protein